MIGAIVGDIAGSRFERSCWKGVTLDEAECIGFDDGHFLEDAIGERATSFEFFHPSCFVTDDTLMTVAIMDWLLEQNDLRQTLRRHFRNAPNPNLFGRYFRQWAISEDASTCGSVGNGAAMRVSPVALVSEDLKTVRELARESALVTHDFDHAIVGAEAIAAAVFMARKGESKEEIKAYASKEFCYDLDLDLDKLRSGYAFSSDCRATVPIAIVAFLESNSHEETIRRAISMGGDTDTIACMAGAIAGCFWQVSDANERQTWQTLDSRSAKLLLEFEKRFPLVREM